MKGAFTVMANASKVSLEQQKDGTLLFTTPAGKSGNIRLGFSRNEINVRVYDESGKLCGDFTAQKEDSLEDVLNDWLALDDWFKKEAEECSK